MIRINENLTPEGMLVALWHEIYHLGNICLEETEVEWMAQLTSQVLLDNKQIFGK